MRSVKITDKAYSYLLKKSAEYSKQENRRVGFNETLDKLLFGGKK